MSTETEEDLSSYPLLRPDRISALTTMTLLRSQTDIMPLVLGAAGDELMSYAQRQLQLVNDELKRRDENALAEKEKERRDVFLKAHESTSTQYPSTTTSSPPPPSNDGAAAHVTSSMIMMISTSVTDTSSNSSNINVSKHDKHSAGEPEVEEIDADAELAEILQWAYPGYVRKSVVGVAPTKKINVEDDNEEEEENNEEVDEEEVNVSSSSFMSSHHQKFKRGGETSYPHHSTHHHQQQQQQQQHPNFFSQGVGGQRAMRGGRKKKTPRLAIALAWRAEDGVKSTTMMGLNTNNNVGNDSSFNGGTTATILRDFVVSSTKRKDTSSSAVDADKSLTRTGKKTQTKIQPSDGDNDDDDDNDKQQEIPSVPPPPPPLPRQKRRKQESGSVLDDLPSKLGQRRSSRKPRVPLLAPKQHVKQDASSSSSSSVPTQALVHNVNSNPSSTSSSSPPPPLSLTEPNNSGISFSSSAISTPSECLDVTGSSDILPQVPSSSPLPPPPSSPPPPQPSLSSYSDSSSPRKENNGAFQEEATLTDSPRSPPPQPHLLLHQQVTPSHKQTPLDSVSSTLEKRSTPCGHDTPAPRVLSPSTTKVDDNATSTMTLSNENVKESYEAQVHSAKKELISSPLSKEPAVVFSGTPIQHTASEKEEGVFVKPSPSTINDSVPSLSSLDDLQRAVSETNLHPLDVEVKDGRGEDVKNDCDNGEEEEDEEEEEEYTDEDDEEEEWGHEQENTTLLSAVRLVPTSSSSSSLLTATSSFTVSPPNVHKIVNSSMNLAAMMSVAPTSSFSSSSSSSTSTTNHLNEAHILLAPPQVKRIPRDYSDQFPDFRSIFTGCLSSSTAIGTLGGFSSARNNNNSNGNTGNISSSSLGGGGTAVSRSSIDMAISPEVASMHVTKILTDWLSVCAGGPNCKAAEERLCAMGPAYKSDLSSSSSYNHDDDSLMNTSTTHISSRRPSTSGSVGSVGSHVMGAGGGVGAHLNNSVVTYGDALSTTLQMPPQRWRSRSRIVHQSRTGRGEHCEGDSLLVSDTTEEGLDLVKFASVTQDRPEVYTLVSKALHALPAFSEVPLSVGTAPVWSLMWTWGKPPVQRNLLLVWQKVNHFRNASELTRKDLLKKNLSRYTVLGGRMAAAFSLQPTTFVLPSQYLAFCEAFGKASNAGNLTKGVAMDNMTKLISDLDIKAGVAPAASIPNYWIMKPVGLSRGRGIRVISGIDQVRYSEDMVIQKYVHNPMLLEGHKFDLRIYVLVTSFSPLEAFIYKRGYARLSSRPYNLIAGELTDRFIHLTNAAVNRQNQNASVLECLRDASSEEAGGTKCSLEYLWRKLEDSNIDTEAVWKGICDVVVKSLVCADDVIPHQPNSFELFGYDIMIDEDLKPWLIEVNSSPSMETDCAFDVQTKTELIYDTIKLVDPVAFDAEALVKILQRRGDMSALLSKRGPSSGVTPAAAFGSGSRMSAANRNQLNEDIDAILCGKRIRPLGELPDHLGNYQRICPGSEAFSRAMKLKISAFKR